MRSSRAVVRTYCMGLPWSRMRNVVPLATVGRDGEDEVVVGGFCEVSRVCEFYTAACARCACGDSGEVAKFYGRDRRPRRRRLCTSPGRHLRRHHRHLRQGLLSRYFCLSRRR